MKNIIGIKTNKGLIGTLITIITLLCFIVICILRIINSELELLIKIMLGCLAGFGIFYLIKELINLIDIISKPKELLIIENDSLIINHKKEKTIIKIEDIVEIIPKENNKILFYQSDLIINTKDSKYIITNLKNLKEILDSLNELKG